MPGPGSSGLQLSRLDLDHPDRFQKDRGTKVFGWVDHFVPFASGSLEDLWAETETHLPTAFDALDNGTALKDPNVKAVLLDTVALHFVRTLRIREAHHRAWEHVFATHYLRMVTQDADRVRFAALSEHNLHLAGPEGVQYFANRYLELSKSMYDSKALLRTGMEEKFHLARERLAHSGLEVITPLEGEFLIGDAPALSLRYTLPPGSVIFGVPLGDANTVILPLGPRHLIALGREDKTVKVPKGAVDRLNHLQIQTANQHVHYRPKSPLVNFIQHICTSGKRTAARVTDYGPPPTP